MRLEYKGGRLHGKFEMLPDHLVGPGFTITNPATDKGEPQEIYRYRADIVGEPPCLVLEDSEVADRSNGEHG